MRTPALFLGILGLALATAGSAAAQGPVARGRQLVERNCAMCHATGLRGDSPSASAPRFRELGRRYPLEMLEEALAEGILTRHPAMPQFRFTAPEVNDIISYLNSIQSLRKASS
jgi:cytochrome c